MNSGQPRSRKVILVTGPANSGKSEWAELLAAQTEKAVIYVATAQVDATDQEWQTKIEKHALRRPESWQTLLVPVKLATTISAALPSSCLLVDSLGTWVANLLEQDEAAWEKTTQQLIESLQQATADVIVVGEETGWGVVPAYAAGRKFRSRLGNLVRQVGAIASDVYLVTGGHVLNLSILGSPLPISSQIGKVIPPSE